MVKAEDIIKEQNELRTNKKKTYKKIKKNGFTVDLINKNIIIITW